MEWNLACDREATGKFRGHFEKISSGGECVNKIVCSQRGHQNSKKSKIVLAKGMESLKRLVSGFHSQNNIGIEESLAGTPGGGVGFQRKGVSRWTRGHRREW